MAACRRPGRQLAQVLAVRTRLAPAWGKWCTSGLRTARAVGLGDQTALSAPKRMFNAMGPMEAIRIHCELMALLCSV